MARNSGLATSIQPWVWMFGRRVELAVKGALELGLTIDRAEDGELEVG